MKKLINIAFFALLAPTAMCVADLMPAGSAACISYRTGDDMSGACEAGAQFYMDQSGRCGCLTNEEMMQPAVCAVVPKRCNDEAAQTFSSLFQYRNMCGMIENVYAGCGCYADRAAIRR